MDESNYKDIFVAEAAEYLQLMNENLLQLEDNPGEAGYLSELFRAAHSLKGMSATMGYSSMVALTHCLENILEQLCSEKIRADEQVVDLLFMAMDYLQKMLDNLDGLDNYEEEIRQFTEEVTRQLQGEKIDHRAPCVLGGGSGRGFPLSELEKQTLALTLSEGKECHLVRVEIREDCLMKSVRAYMVIKAINEGGEIIAVNPPVEDLEENGLAQHFSVVFTGISPEELHKKLARVSELAEVSIVPFAAEQENLITNEQGTKKVVNFGNRIQSGEAAGKSSNKMVRVETEKLDSLVNLVGELVIKRTRVIELGKRTGSEDLRRSLEQLERIIMDLQNAAMKLRMVDMKQVFERFPRMVRDLSKSRGKQINLVISGEDTELDRTIVNVIADPLVHLLRNAVDHGIENEEERRRQGKETAGTIKLQARHEGSHVVIAVEDDGRGLDPQLLRQKAVQKKIITEEEAASMDREELFNLIFEPSFTVLRRRLQIFREEV